MGIVCQDALGREHEQDEVDDQIDDRRERVVHHELMVRDGHVRLEMTHLPVVEVERLTQRVGEAVSEEASSSEGHEGCDQVRHEKLLVTDDY